MHYEPFGPELDYCRRQNALLQVGLFIDDRGLLQCQGRIKNALLNIYNKKPALLPPGHTWVKSLIQHVHKKIKQSGTAVILATLQERH